MQVCIESNFVAGYGKISAKAMGVETIVFALRRLLMALNEGISFSISMLLLVMYLTNVQMG